MTDKGNKKFYLENPIIALNGLVTDKNEYSYDQIIQFINRKKKKITKGKIIQPNSFINNNNQNKNINKKKVKEENIININEELDSNEIKNNNNSPFKSPIKKTNKNRNKNLNKINNSSNMHSQKYEFEENKDKQNNIKKEYEKNKKIINDDFSVENENLSESNTDIKNNNSFNNKDEVNIKYKNVEKCNLNYDEIKKKCENNSCVFISLFSHYELESKIDINSTFQLFKNLKDEDKDQIILSEKNKEINLINSLLNKNDKNNNLFYKLGPQFNNTLKYLPSEYCGVNNYGFMKINSFNNEDNIQFITPFFKDRTNQYTLKFRKYIMNLSLVPYNKENENNIYHIIIPKNDVDKIDINFNEEININDFLRKITGQYYFYKQSPGELLIVEPGCIHLSYYKKTKNLKEKEKYYLLMFWNKMYIDSLSDYIFLQNNCYEERFKNFPILSMLLNLVNKKLEYLSSDYIKVIWEIYNKIDSYENINNYINKINNNNISFHKLFLKNINICSDCHQEIFNFYVYYNTDNDDGQILCINCANLKKYLLIPKSIIFFKFQKDEIESFISKIFSNFKKGIGITIENNDDEKIISKYFDLNNREDDCLNIDELILKIDGPLKIIDKESQEKNNFLLYKDFEVDKYIKYIENDKINNYIDIDPLDHDNFKNNLTINDIYEKISYKEHSSRINEIQDNFDNNKNIIDTKKNNKSKNIHENINILGNNKKIIKNIENTNSFNNKSRNSRIIQNNEEENLFIKNNFDNKSKNEKEKKKGSTISDLIAGGMF